MNNFFQTIKIISENHQDKVSFTLIEGNIVKDFSYREINVIIDKKRVVLGQIDNSNPILLLHLNTIEFITSFLACQSLGIICIPMFYPRNKRHFERLKVIIKDSNCRFALVDMISAESMLSQLKKHDDLIKVVDWNFKVKNSSISNDYKTNPISFIQYTSGSTGSPKGVIVTQENLLFNQEMIKKLFGCNSRSIILSWLPIYHDMGLIGNVLHSLYVGATCVLMSPLDVVQNPNLWLKAISNYKVTHSGGPNFIYDSCTFKISDSELDKLDLSSWQVAYNGSEPIKFDTIEKFLNRFESCGFNKKSFYTCYGLAEATLLVSGGVFKHRGKPEVSSGKICEDVEVKFLDVESGQINQSNGEILLYGKSISSGYWNNDSPDLFFEIDGKIYLRTGDFGRIEDGELIIKGRLKELIIINGKNYYPYDIEDEISKSVSSIESNGVIVSYINSNNSEVPIVFCEVQRDALSNLNPEDIIYEIDNIIFEILSIEAHDILLFTSQKLSRTSSGKLQRVKTKEGYLNNDLEYFSSKLTTVKAVENQADKCVYSILIEGDYEKVQKYLTILLNNKLKTSLTEESFFQNLMDLGIDSLKSVDLVNTINNDLELNIEVTTLMNLTTTVDFEEFIKNLIWMKATKSEGEEIII